MFDALDPRSPVPLYAQIAGRVRAAIVAGELGEGSGLPSVRRLSADLRVNPATVVQAYRELEAEGLVETRRGSGTFVLPLGDGVRARGLRAEARRLVRGLLEDAARGGIDRRTLLEAWTDAVGSDPTQSPAAYAAASLHGVDDHG